MLFLIVFYDMIDFAQFKEIEIEVVVFGNDLCSKIVSQEAHTFLGKRESL